MTHRGPRRRSDGQADAIAQLAAKAFLSPKTVAFHVYSVYPKLQITTRSQLVPALEGTGQMETVALAG
jgi:DNA-binding CsgD family transcriptional regulator